MKDYVDIGSGFYTTFVSDGDIEKAGIIIWRIEPREPRMVAYNPENDPDPDHVYMAHAICIFDLSGLEKNPVRWELKSLDPLHIEPSIQMYDRKADVKTYHGHIRGGRWVPA